MASRGFKETLAVGNVAEQAYMKLLMTIIPSCSVWKSERGQVGWDVGAEFGDVTFFSEVKFDQKEATTGNIAVEFWNSKKNMPSGLGATDADLWVFVLHKPMTIWVSRVDALRQFVGAVTPTRTLLNAGDNNAAIHLYPRGVILDTFTRIDEMSGELLGKVLSKLLLKRGVA